MDIAIKYKDVVVRYDGLKGVVTGVYDETVNGGIIARVKYETGEFGTITVEDRENGFRDYYNIGENVFGNAMPLDQMRKMKAEAKEAFISYKKQLDEILPTVAHMREMMAKYDLRYKQVKKQQWRIRRLTKGVPENEDENGNENND